MPTKVGIQSHGEWRLMALDSGFAGMTVRRVSFGLRPAPAIGSYFADRLSRRT
ncbi:MAG: hypothetical protein NTW01_12140 [Gammaproteobacteria bacterium]|nr:hypothetical protein [Gammaproteobacteria bacterium]